MDVEQNYATVTPCVVAKSYVLSTAQPEIYVQGFKFTDYGDGSPPMGPRFFRQRGTRYALPQIFLHQVCVKISSLVTPSFGPHLDLWLTSFTSVAC